MERKIIQIEGLDAAEIMARFDKMESAISALSDNSKSAEPQKPEKYITRREVSDILRVSVVTVSDWTRKGILIAYKVGNRVYYKSDEVENALVKKGGAYVRG